ncbi:MAG: response regulator [Polyangiaceae bacterium]|nr:response regulator [Polyangiaceae bacterium]
MARYLTVANYVLVSLLWMTILVLYLRFRKMARSADPLVSTLAAVLALDAFRSALKNLFFGIVWTGNYGIAFTGASKVLSRPEVLVVPKLLNTGVAIAVLAIVVRRWLPAELRERRNRNEERARLVEKLEASLSETAIKEERWQLALRANRDGILDIDTKSGIAWVSPRYAETFGYSAEELPTLEFEAWKKLIHPDDRDEAVKGVEGILADASAPHVFEFRQRAKDGHYRTISFRAAAVRDEAGEATRLVASNTDVTERREAQAALAARQRTESLGLLAGGIAHDFNNLLAVMKVNLSLIRRFGVAPAATGPLEDLDGTVAHASELTSRLLAYSGRGRFVIAPVHLSALVQDLARLLGAAVPPNVHIETSFEETLPTVVADTAQIQQVVMNLLTNAIDAIGEKDGSIFVRTRIEQITEPIAGVAAGEPVRPPGRYVVVEVEDTGKGMTDETRSHMFEPFFSTKGTGRGLGMSAILGILRAHEAGMRVRTAPGQGTTFTVFIPLPEMAVEEVSHETAPPPQVVSGHPPAAQHPVRCALVVDDDITVRRTVARIVQRIGYIVDEAADGTEAVAHLEEGERPYDLVLLDLTMPHLDGRAVHARLRARSPELPVVVMSGYGSEGAPVDERTTFVAKPFDARQLDAAIRALVGVPISTPPPSVRDLELKEAANGK